MEEIKLNSHCVNAKIKYHILSDEKMKEIGFNKNYYEGTDYEEYSPYWWFTRMIQTMAHYPAMVVVNARGKDNRILGTVKEIMTVEEYGKGVTAQVVGVVNMDGYIVRVEEENRLKELAKKKAAIEKELEAEINKRKSVEYYEEMAKKYSDNPKLAELVAELKGLGD